MRSDGITLLAVEAPNVAESRLAQPSSAFEHRLEYRRKVAGRGIDDAQYPGGRGLLSERLVARGRALIQLSKRFVPLGSAFCKLASKVGNDLPRIGYRAVGRRAHLRTSFNRLPTRS